MVWAGIAIVVIAVLVSLVGAIWVGVPALIAGLILLVIALVRGLRHPGTAEPPA